MTEETKKYLKSQVVGSVIPALAIALPLAVTFFVFLSRLDTRVTVVEKTSVTQRDLESALRRILKEELKPVLGSHEERIRCLEIEVNKGHP